MEVIAIGLPLIGGAIWLKHRPRRADIWNWIAASATNESALGEFVEAEWNDTLRSIIADLRLAARLARFAAERGGLEEEKNVAE